jgi:hypothetical protein
MSSIRIVALLAVLGLLAACAQQTFDAGARAALAVVEDERTRIPASPPPPRCPQAHYRLPVVTQIQVPDTIIGGVLIPRHTTYVVLQPGAWQMVNTEVLRQPGALALPPGCHALHRGR